MRRPQSFHGGTVPANEKLLAGRLLTSAPKSLTSSQRGIPPAVKTRTDPKCSPEEPTVTPTASTVTQSADTVTSLTADTVTPAVVTATPKVDTLTPKVAEATPTVDTATPKVVTATPKVATGIPKVVTATPKVDTATRSSDTSTSLPVDTVAPKADTATLVYEKQPELPSLATGLSVASGLGLALKTVAPIAPLRSNRPAPEPPKPAPRTLRKSVSDEGNYDKIQRPIFGNLNFIIKFRR